jgi:hypothetical protein
MATKVSVSSRLQVQTFALALGILDVRYDLREPSSDTLSLPGERRSEVFAT